MRQPNCYSCVHSRAIPNENYLACWHRDVPRTELPTVKGLKQRDRGVSLGQPVIVTAHAGLNIKLNGHGFTRYRGIWPSRFDPVFVENCNGYEKRKLEKRFG